MQKNHSKFLFRTNNQITTGAPIIDVIALIGNVVSNPGNCDAISQNNIIIPP